MSWKNIMYNKMEEMWEEAEAFAWGDKGDHENPHTADFQLGYELSIL